MTRNVTSIFLDALFRIILAGNMADNMAAARMSQVVDQDWVTWLWPKVKLFRTLSPSITCSTVILHNHSRSISEIEKKGKMNATLIS